MLFFDLGTLLTFPFFFLSLGLPGLD